SSLMLTNGSTAMVRRSPDWPSGGTGGADAAGRPGGGPGSASEGACVDGAGAGDGTDTGPASVRATPPGPMSNIQPMAIAIGKPSATSTITRVTDQGGRFSAGSTTEATSMTIQPATAYSRSTRITRLRLRSAKKPPPASACDPPPMSSPRVARPRAGRSPVQRSILPPQVCWGPRRIRGFPAMPRLGVDLPDIRIQHRGTRMNHRFLLSAALLAFIGTAAAQQQSLPSQPAQQQTRPAQQQLTPQQQAQLAKQNSDMSKAALQVMQMVDANQIGEIWDNASATMKRVVSRDDFVKQITIDRNRLGTVSSRGNPAVSRSQFPA